MWILHLLARNYVSVEKPLDSHELWKCEHYGSGDKSGCNSSKIHYCWDIRLGYFIDQSFAGKTEATFILSYFFLTTYFVSLLICFSRSKVGQAVSETKVKQ